MDLLRYKVIIIMYCYESSAASDFLKEQLSSISGTNDGVVEEVCAGMYCIVINAKRLASRAHLSDPPPLSLSLATQKGLPGLTDLTECSCLSVLWSHLLKLRVTNEHKADGYHFTPMLR